MKALLAKHLGVSTSVLNFFLPILKEVFAGYLERLLPILDNFELGLDAARSEDSAKGIVEGFSMVHRQLGDFLQSSGLQLIDAEGQPFDPKLHEALGHEVDPSRPEGVVLRQLRRGYRLADRLVRPASVIVNKVS